MEQPVYELQQMALDKNVDIEELLRKAYLIAVSTNQKDIEEWVLNEQNGYKSVDNLPEYRFLQGELKAYNDMMNEARELATNRMVQEAEHLGADAIVNVRYASSAIMQGAAEVIVYGTAVRFR